MKQILLIALLAIVMATSLTLQNVQAQNITLPEGKVNVKTSNVDINIIGGEGKVGPQGPALCPQAQ